MRKKAPWTSFPLCIGLSELKSLKATDAKIEEIMRLYFGMMSFHRYDSRKICRQHCDKIKYIWPYGTITIPEDKDIKN